LNNIKVKYSKTLLTGSFVFPNNELPWEVPSNEKPVLDGAAVPKSLLDPNTPPVFAAVPVLAPKTLPPLAVPNAG